MRFFLMTIMTLSVSGCGTMANLDGKRYALISASGQMPVRLYGGVRNDIRWVAEGIGIPEGHRQNESDTSKRQAATISEDPIGVALGLPIFSYFAVVDPVLSLIGDTVTLPQVIIERRAPNPQWLTDFQKADTLLIQKYDREVSISDAETIARLKKIYANAKWKTYWATLPGNLDERTISLIGDDKTLRHISYTGSLWERQSYTENRTADLSEVDRQWIESLFSMVPESDLMGDTEMAKITSEVGQGAP